jgi:hypothetical protein
MKESEVKVALSAVLAPYLGPNMARAAVDSNFKRFKPDGGPLAPAELESLLLRLGKGLVVFVGEDKAAALQAELRQAVLLPSSGASDRWDGDETVSRKIPSP